MKKLLAIADRLDAINDWLGRTLSYGVILLVLVQFALIIMSSNFRIGSIKLQELLLYINSLMFLGAAGYVLLKDAHVRVDVFYREAPERKKARINFLGTVFFLFPLMAFVWVIGLPYALTSIGNLEGSFETSGLQFVYILKSFILLFAFSLSVQGASLAIRSWSLLRRTKR